MGNTKNTKDTRDTKDTNNTNNTKDTRIATEEFIPTMEFYSQVIDSLQDYAIFTLNKDLFINSWSSGAAKIFGYETKEVLGKDFDVIFTKEDIKNGIHRAEIKTALKEGKAVDNRYHKRKDGSTFYAYGLVFPIKGKDEELLGYVKILRDLTESKEAEEASKKHLKDLEDLNIHKESILAILSHDLRSPLSGIIQMAELLKDDYKTMEDDQLKKMLDSQYELAKNELDMLDYLLEWARIKYASTAFAPKKNQLLPYIDKVFEILKGVAAIKSIHLHNEIEENTIVFADRKMMLSILQNLVSNAIGHSYQGGIITITARGKDKMILVQVKDEGVGMSKQTLENLFKPKIKKLSESRKEDQGAGIGLLLVKGFVEKQGGEICVDSVHGEGTSFYFTLPTEKPKENKDSVDKIEFVENAK